MKVVPQMVLPIKVWREIRDKVGSLPPESGGILGGSGSRVTRFFFDKDASVTCFTYEPSYQTLNRVIEEWALEDVEFLGILHSHPSCGGALSPSDVRYARDIMRENPELGYVDMLLYLDKSPRKVVGFRVTREGTEPLTVYTPLDGNETRA